MFLYIISKYKYDIYGIKQSHNQIPDSVTDLNTLTSVSQMNRWYSHYFKLYMNNTLTVTQHKSNCVCLCLLQTTMRQSTVISLLSECCFHCLILYKYSSVNLVLRIVLQRLEHDISASLKRLIIVIFMFIFQYYSLPISFY